MGSDMVGAGVDCREEDLDTRTLVGQANQCARQIGRLQVFIEQLESKLTPILLPEEFEEKPGNAVAEKEDRLQISSLGADLQVISRELNRLETRINQLLARVQL